MPPHEVTLKSAAVDRDCGGFFLIIQAVLLNYR